MEAQPQPREALRSAFLEQHAGQLQSTGLPRSLWARVFEKLVPEKECGDTRVMDGGAAFAFEYDEEATLPHLRYRVVAARDLAAFEDVFLIDHVWMFGTPATALEQLKLHAPVAERMAMLMGVERGAEQSAEAHADTLLDEMQRYAYPLSDSTGGCMHYVMDELGSRIGFSARDTAPNVALKVFLDEDKGEMFTLVWPLAAIGAGTLVTREVQNRMSVVGLKKRAWEIRAETEDKFDWYVEYDGSGLRDIVIEHVKRDARAVIIGSGCSMMPMQMVADGFTNVLATDYVDGIIIKMSSAYPPSNYHDKLRWSVLDAMAMSGIEDRSMDAVLDKGCLDAQCVVEGAGGNEAWGDELQVGALDMLRETSRVLSLGGVYLVCSWQRPAQFVELVHAAPHTELKLLTHVEITSPVKPELAKAGITAPTTLVYVFERC